MKKGHDARIRFVESHLDKKLAFQLRGLRGDLSQEQMEQKVGIKQQALSRLENPYYGKATLTTLKKIAAACDVGLLVEFVPFSQLVNRASGTPYTEYGYGTETMNVPSFDEQERKGTLENEGAANSRFTFDVLDRALRKSEQQEIARQIGNLSKFSGIFQKEPEIEQKNDQDKKEPKRLHLGRRNKPSQRLSPRKEILWKKLHRRKPSQPSHSFSGEERITSPYMQIMSNISRQSGT